MRYVHSLGSMSSAKMEGKLKKPLDYINIILQIVEHVLSWPCPENEETVRMPYLVIVSTKTIRRTFIIKSDQIVSFSFPFHIYKKIDTAETPCKWRVKHKNIDVNTVILSKCRELYNDYKDHQDKRTYQEIASDQDLSDANTLMAIRLFEMLMMTEPAYVRYDYDPKGANGQKHPLCHFDCNFIDEHHYKIGLHNRINLTQVEDLLNKSTDSWFIAKYKESVLDKKKKFEVRFAAIRKKNKCTRKRKKRK